jgi:hypothetical protein
MPMKCKNCGREIIRIRSGGRSVACDAAPITYWSVRGGAAMSEAIPLLTPNGESVYGALDGKLKDAVGMAYHPHTCGLLPIFHRGRDSWSRPIYDDGEGCFLVDVDPRAGRKPDICTKQGNDFNGEPCDPVEADFIFIPRRDAW